MTEGKRKVLVACAQIRHGKPFITAYMSPRLTERSWFLQALDARSIVNQSVVVPFRKNG